MKINNRLVVKQHGSYRSKDEIIYEILTAAKEYESKGGIYKKKLLYMSRLNSWQFGRYLRELLDNGLLTCSLTGREVAASTTNYRKKKGGRRSDTFHVTQKGLQYLLMVDEMQRSVPGVHI